MNWPFNGQHKPGTKPPELSSQDQKLYELEMRIVGLEETINILCQALKDNLDRIDENTQALDNNMHRLAALTLRPPKDLLGGTQEPN